MYQFNLERAISAWRRSLEHSGAFLADDLNELENHLRDHVAHLVEQGVEEKDGYAAALQRIGSHASLESEYRKVRFGSTKRELTLRQRGAVLLQLLKSYVVTTIRNLRRNKAYAAINVLGLAVGMSACLLIGRYVEDELSFDRFHDNADRIVVLGNYSSGAPSLSTPYPLSGTLESDLPEIERSVTATFGQTRTIVDVTSERKVESSVTLASPGFFELFSFPLSIGDPKSVLADPNGAVVTKGVAARLFGDANPVGRSITVDMYGAERMLTVVSVADDPPPNSSIQFGVIASISLLPDGYPKEGSWGASMYRTYALLDRGEALDGLDERIRLAIDARVDREDKPVYRAIPLVDFYLSDLHRTSGFAGNKRYVYIFTSIALIILLIAAVNYLNLATALATRRIHEIGVRKAVGARRSQLVHQFAIESLLVSACALGLAVVISVPARAILNDLFDKELTLTPDASLAGLCLLVVGVALFAGTCPAVILSRLKPTRVLGGEGALSVGGRGLIRQGLVAYQFAVSLLLIIGTLVIHQQLRYVHTKSLGFEGDQVLSVRLPSADWERRSWVRAEALRHPAVLSASVANGAPASFGVRLGLKGEELSPAIEDREETFRFAPASVDEAYVKTLGLNVLKGRDFSSDYSSDQQTAYILNETAAQQLGWTASEAIGKPFRLGAGSVPMGSVIGVVEDFHIKSLREEIEPVVLQLRDDRSWSSAPLLLARLSPLELADGLDHLRQLVQRIAPDASFDYEFLDDRFEAMYREEVRLGRIFAAFAFLAVFLACLGLVGLTLYAVESRMKEIGIRKVVGATVANIVALLSVRMLILVGIGFIFAAPASYFLMSRWLQEFAYRVDISPILIVFAGTGMLAIAAASVAAESIRAALVNPAESLRFE